jgi:hypothetical protein
MRAQTFQRNASTAAAALPHYDDLVLFNPWQCGAAAVTFEVPALPAGTCGLTVNAGEVAGASDAGRATYCADLERRLGASEVGDDSVCLVHPANEGRLGAATSSLVRGTVDTLRVYVTRHSCARGRESARVE